MQFAVISKVAAILHRVREGGKVESENPRGRVWLDDILFGKRDQDGKWDWSQEGIEKWNKEHPSPKQLSVVDLEMGSHILLQGTGCKGRACPAIVINRTWGKYFIRHKMTCWALGIAITVIVGKAHLTFASIDLPHSSHKHPYDKALETYQGVLSH